MKMLKPRNRNVIVFFCSTL